MMPFTFMMISRCVKLTSLPDYVGYLVQKLNVDVAWECLE